MKWLIKAEIYRPDHWHPKLNIVVYEYGRWWFAEVNMFYDQQLSKKVLKEYLPHDVVDKIFDALAELNEVEVEFELKQLPGWPWKPDQKALKEVYFFPGNLYDPTSKLLFKEDGFSLKVNSQGKSREAILKHFPSELQEHGERLYSKYAAKPYVYCGIDINNQNQPAVG